MKDKNYYLKHDSLEEIEKLIGKHWSEFDDRDNWFALMKAMQDNEEKTNFFKSIGDTYYGINWYQFKNLLLNKGFKIGYSYLFKNNSEEAIIFYHQKNGFILWAESYNGTSLNSGTIYLQVQAKSKEQEREVFLNLHTGGMVDEEKRIFNSSIDVRNGLFSNLSILAESGIFLPIWQSKDRFLWFVDYEESKQNGYDYKKITNDKIAKCPKDLRKIISGV